VTSTRLAAEEGVEPDRNLGLRLLPSGPTLLALLTLAALAAWRVLPAPEARSVPSPAGGLPAVPGLLLEPRDLDLGCLEPGSRREVALAWRREGLGPIKVLAIETGCGCLGLTGLPCVLPEGAAGTALLALRAGTDPGPVEASMCVVLGVPPPGDVLRVRLRAYVGRSVVVRPAWLDLGRRTPAGRASSRFAVHLPPGTEAAEVAVHLVAWSGAVRCDPPLLVTQRGPDLVLESTFPSGAGLLTGALVVRTRSAGETVVPLRAEVVAACAHPPAASGP
jgi:hypothetical protein